MRIHITSKSLKPAAGALALTLAIMSPVGGCGHRVTRLGAEAPSTMTVTSSAQFSVGNTVK